MQSQWEALHPFSQHILQAYPVRKNRTQKELFRNETTGYLQGLGWPVQVQSGGFLIKSKNIVVGDPQTAKLVFTAHYDTPARLPFPNFIAPCNLCITFLYQLLLSAAILLVPALAIPAIVSLAKILLPTVVISGSVVSLLMLFFLLGILYLMLAGPANPGNANDNTSGVLTLLEIAHSLPVHLRPKVALVLFDNEELGLLGSAAFKKNYGALHTTTLINFDCVGDGDTLLFAQPRACCKDKLLQEYLARSFSSNRDKKVEISTSPFTFYPSDQRHFARGIGVVALRKAPVVGLYLARIHTKKDTKLEQENVLLLRDGAQNLAELV